MAARTVRFARVAHLGRTSLTLCAWFLLAASCDAERVNLDDDGGGAGGQDGGAVAGEDSGGGGGGRCEPAKAQCNNCIDDDKDGLTDGSDPHCAGPLDDDEATFSTGIPGDNQDDKKQDCFFDGNSGMCQVHTCCLLPAPCDEETYGIFNPETDCALADSCVEDCVPLTPPGCDCFGCCTICAPGNGECFDILISTAISPDCDVNDLGSDACVKCVKSEVCSAPDCDPDACILCPGQSDDDLPPGCDGDNQCPGGATCKTSGDCEGNDYCSNECCIDTVD
jgi:hypothetical protein